MRTNLDTIEKATYLPNPENFGKGKKHAEKKPSKPGAPGKVFKSVKHGEKASHARRAKNLISTSIQDVLTK